MQISFSCLSRFGLVAILSLPITSWAQPTSPTTDNTLEVNQRLDFLYGQHQPYQKFLKDFQTATYEHHKNQVVTMINYPIKINLHGKKVTFKSRQDLLKRYDEIFDPMLVKTIQEQKYENLFANTRGVMIGESGEIWFSGFCVDKDCKKVDIKVIAINK